MYFRMLNVLVKKSETLPSSSSCFAYIGFVFFLVSSVTCADGRSPKKYLPCALVVGGRNAAEGRFPYMCSIRDKRSGNHSCGATLIDKRWLLTAAHCLDIKYASSTGVDSEIYCDIYRKNELNTSKTYSVDTIYMHSKWVSNIKKGYDIALIKLDREADLPVPILASATTPHPRGDGFSVLGWGLTNPEQCTDKLQIGLDLDVVSKYKCSRDNMWGVIITGSMICAGTGSVDTAEGDSGGPFVQLDDPAGHYQNGDPSLDLVVGITSFGVGESTREKDSKPGVYTSVSFFREWIDCVIERKMNKDDCPAVSVKKRRVDSPSSQVPSPIVKKSSQRHSKKRSRGKTSRERAEEKDALARMEKAIKKDDSASVERILKEGLDPNTKYTVIKGPLPMNTSLLHQAAFYNAADTAEVLVDREADVDIRDSQERTPLHVAAESDSLGVVKVLVEGGAKVNAKSRRGDSPLHFAAYYGYESIVKFLVNEGADVNSKNDNKETPLRMAAARGHVSIVELLLENKASKLQTEDRGQTPFDVICQAVDRDMECNDETKARLKKLLRID